MKILLIDPFKAGSHALWGENLMAFSGHNIRTLSLEGRFWKWRMRWGSVLLARKYSEEASDPDLILASSLLDLSTFIGFLAKKGIRIPPIVLYCHENQLLYPTPDDRPLFREQRNEFGGIDARSVLIADRVFFNSEFHRREGLRAFRDLLDRAPEKEGSKLLNGIEERTGVFPPAPDLQDLDRSRGERIDTGGENPVLLWNHRWEAEKGPERFGSIVRSLIAEGIDLKLILAGPTGNSEGIRQKLADEFPERVLFAKKFDDREAYIQALYRSDLCLVTSDQDFFGLSVVEAMYLQVVPILPDRLAYPEHLSEELRERLLYRNEKEALGIAHKLLKKGRGELPEQVRGSVAPYDIRRWIDRFDQELERVARYQHG